MLFNITMHVLCTLPCVRDVCMYCTCVRNCMFTEVVVGLVMMLQHLGLIVLNILSNMCMCLYLVRTCFRIHALAAIVATDTKLHARAKTDFRLICNTKRMEPQIKRLNKWKVHELAKIRIYFVLGGIFETVFSPNGWPKSFQKV